MEWIPKYGFVDLPLIQVLKTHLIKCGMEMEEIMKIWIQNANEELIYICIDRGGFNGVAVNREIDLTCQEFCQAVDHLYS